MTDIFISNLLCGSTVLAISKASELARSWLAGVTARMRHSGWLMCFSTISRTSRITLWCCLSSGTFTSPGRSTRVSFKTGRKKKIILKATIYFTKNLLTNMLNIIYCIENGLQNRLRKLFWIRNITVIDAQNVPVQRVVQHISETWQNGNLHLKPFAYQHVS